MKSGICTLNNLLVVSDPGVLSTEDKLTKLFLYACGVDYDGYGGAKSCLTPAGYFMGSLMLRLPLEASYCTHALVGGALSRLPCIKSRRGRKAGYNIPGPPKMSREHYCSGFGAEPCDDEGMEKYEHKRPQRYECYAFCCKKGSKMLQMVAPDGLKCSDDGFTFRVKRCLLGRCKQVR